MFQRLKYIPSGQADLLRVKFCQYLPYCMYSTQIILENNYCNSLKGFFNVPKVVAHS